MTGCECGGCESGESTLAIEKLLVSRLNRFQGVSDYHSRIILQPIFLTMAQYREQFVIAVPVEITLTIERIVIPQLGHKVIPDMPAGTAQSKQAFSLG